MKIRPYFFFLTGFLAVISYSVWGLLSGNPERIAWLTIGYLAFEVFVSVFFFTITSFGVVAWRRTYRKPDDSVTRPVSIVIAAHNESGCILETLDSVFGQVGIVPHCIVASDGSTDGMNELLIRDYDLKRVDGKGTWTGDVPGTPGARLTLLALPKVGKGKVLNAGVAAADSEILFTLDADTLLAPTALLELAAAFDDDKTAAAGGFIYIRDANQGNWMVRHQYVEFFRNFMWRIGLANARICLQVSGAFGAFRRSTLLKVGGFSEQTLVEDYEIIFRIHERLRDADVPYAIRMVPTAVAYTDSPRTPIAFIKQRTRWFAGFLNTLTEYRRMIASPRHRALGLVMLPIKSIDAILPVWGVITLGVLLSAMFFGHESWRWYALSLFVAKWTYDLVLMGLMVRLYRGTFPDRPIVLSPAKFIFTVLTEAFCFHWFRQMAVLNAYRWYVLRIRRWEQSRWTLVPARVGFRDPATTLAAEESQS